MNTTDIDYTGTVPSHTGFIGGRVNLYTRNGLVYVKTDPVRAAGEAVLVTPDNAEALADALRAYARVARQETRS